MNNANELWRKNLTSAVSSLNLTSSEVRRTLFLVFCGQTLIEKY